MVKEIKNIKELVTPNSVIEGLAKHCTTKKSAENMVAGLPNKAVLEPIVSGFFGKLILNEDKEDILTPIFVKTLKLYSGQLDEWQQAGVSKALPEKVQFLREQLSLLSAGNDKLNNLLNAVSKSDKLLDEDKDILKAAIDKCGADADGIKLAMVMAAFRTSLAETLRSSTPADSEDVIVEAAAHTAKAKTGETENPADEEEPAGKQLEKLANELIRKVTGCKSDKDIEETRKSNSLIMDTFKGDAMKDLTKRAVELKSVTDESSEGYSFDKDCLYNLCHNLMEESLVDPHVDKVGELSVADAIDIGAKLMYDIARPADENGGEGRGLAQNIGYLVGANVMVSLLLSQTDKNADWAYTLIAAEHIMKCEDKKVQNLIKFTNVQNFQSRLDGLNMIIKKEVEAEDGSGYDPFDPVKNINTFMGSVAKAMCMAEYYIRDGVKLVNDMLNPVVQEAATA